MGRRIDLQMKLAELMAPYAQLGLSCVYYQPPASVKLVYPCIIYTLDKIDTRHADNNPYIQKERYSLTVIDRDPDSEVMELVKKLPMCTFDRHYTADNLHHFVFTIYY